MRWALMAPSSVVPLAPSASVRTSVAGSVEVSGSSDHGPSHAHGVTAVVGNSRRGDGVLHPLSVGTRGERLLHEHLVGRWREGLLHQLLLGVLVVAVDCTDGVNSTTHVLWNVARGALVPVMEGLRPVVRKELLTKPSC